MRSKKSLAGLVLAASMFCGPALANTYNFSFADDVGDSLSLTITTAGDPGPLGGTGAPITSITGFGYFYIGSGAVSGPVADPSVNNLLYSTPFYLDSAGMMFSFLGSNVRFYTDYNNDNVEGALNLNTAFCIGGSCDRNIDEYNTRLTLNEVATPLPAALPLFAGGLGVIGLLARRKKRKNAAALTAA